MFAQNILEGSVQKMGSRVIALRAAPGGFIHVEPEAQFKTWLDQQVGYFQ